MAWLVEHTTIEAIFDLDRLGTSGSGKEINEFNEDVFDKFC